MLDTPAGETYFTSLLSSCGIDALPSDWRARIRVGSDRGQSGTAREESARRSGRGPRRACLIHKKGWSILQPRDSGRFSAMAEALHCWKCGAPLVEVDPACRPHRFYCRACRAEVHVCRMSRFYALSKREAVRRARSRSPCTNKERANICGYFEPVAGRFRPLSPRADSHFIRSFSQAACGCARSGTIRGRRRQRHRRRSRATKSSGSNTNHHATGETCTLVPRERAIAACSHASIARLRSTPQ